MAEALVKYETLDESQLRDIMEGRDPKPPQDWDDTPSASGKPREREKGDAPIGKPASQH
jgi:cell division protease FtsH